MALAAMATLAGVACVPTPTAPTSRCAVEGVILVCPHNTSTLVADAEARQVHWAVPYGSPPAGGWPTVIMFQGSLFSAELTWFGNPAEPFGAYEQTQVVQRLLDWGFAVLTPEAHLNGVTFWDTNNLLIPDYLQSGDHQLMLELFRRIDDGTFGDLDGSRLYATGISSGGYMTSRMALSYPGRFRALAIQSGSWATCAGPICDVPAIPVGHPPTLFLHGGLDPIVPLYTMDLYHSKLVAAGVATKRVVEPLALHRWIPAAPSEVTAWFVAHP